MTTSITPTDEYMQVYDGARKKLEDIGLVFLKRNNNQLIRALMP